MDLSELKLTPKRKENCQKLHLETDEDILRYYPSRYECYEECPFEQWVEKQTVIFRGPVATYPSTYRPRRGLSVSSFTMFYGDRELKITLFNRPWVKLQVGQNVTVIGRYEGKRQVTAMQYSLKGLDEVGGIQPIYPTKEGIRQNDIKKIIEVVYQKRKDDLKETLPTSLLSEHRLMAFPQAIGQIHFPSDKASLAQALSRLKYEEFLCFFLALNRLRNASFEQKPVKIIPMERIKSFVQNLPYALTPDQESAINDILGDMQKGCTMNRLLQGDVGCGKTAVALLALYANALAGYQGALMAPTEILAFQHAETFSRMLKDTGIRIQYLTSSSKDRDVLRDIENGEVDIVIGTHALFSDDVHFKRLGLVITDEQHRFGVLQRRKLKQKAEHCDVLLMSATPIPRTLASSIYGDLDVSTIETMPKGRKEAKTVLIRKNSMVSILPEIKEKLAEGRQMYIIASLIEKNDAFKAKDAVTLFHSLSKALSPYRCALLHGRMNNIEKTEVMNRFKDGEVQILISTTVVEVGVDVANATVMVIYDADRFGLSQIHQLRGRIKRGPEAGICILLSDSKEPETLNRLEVLVKTQNGFEVAKEDLATRGPGDLLGTRQAGLPVFRLGNIVTDNRFIEAAKKDAQRLYESLDEEDILYRNRILSRLSSLD